MVMPRALARWLLPALLLLAVAGGGQATPELGLRLQETTLWPETPAVASYDIAASLDPESHQVTGREVIVYTNRSSDPIAALVFHLYMNAFRSEGTLFLRESDLHRGYAYDASAPGWTEVDTLILQLPGEETAIDLIPSSVVSETLMTTSLPSPLLPGDTLTLTAEFRTQLPRVFARTGFADDFHLVGQWFPKLGVYEEGTGWNAHPFHSNNEFYADFGVYDVAIRLPEEFVVGATGLPSGEQDHQDGTVTHRFHAESVIDFVWTAWPGFERARREVGSTEVVLLYDPAHTEFRTAYLDAAELALESFGAWYGPYPYPRLTVVDVPDAASGAAGMEYPTLITVGQLSPIPGVGENVSALVTFHEVAHQWWQSVVATNEAEEPWLDEGLAEYATMQLMEQAYGPDSLVASLGPLELTALDQERLLFLLYPAAPMAQRAWEYPNANAYNAAVYSKPALAFRVMETVASPERWSEVLRTYYERYRFGHPSTGDFLSVVAEVAGQDARSILEPLVYGEGLVDYAVSGLSCERAGDQDACSVTVSRLGEVTLPVEIEITLADGRQVRETWDGRGTQQTIVTVESVPVVRAEVDPDGEIVLDVALYNNSLTRRVQAGSLVRTASQWFYAVEQLLLLLGGLW